MCHIVVIVTEMNHASKKSHFTMESKRVNARRIAHQKGNAVYTCADFGDTPCMVNGTIGEKVYDDEGSHIGWKRGRDLNLKISNTSPLGSIISTTLRLSLRSTKPSSQLLSLG